MGRQGGDRPGKAGAGLLLLGLLEVAFLAAFGWLDGIAMPLPRLLLPAAAFLCYGAAGFTAGRRAPSLLVIWGVAILARLVLLPLTPELSDDIFRYLWDGHVLLEGVNPYAYPPEHEALATIRTPWHGEINNPGIPTIYPPLSQLLFAVVALAGGTVAAAKALWLCFDLGCGLLLQRIATRTGRPPATVLIWYLWSPLLIVETAWSAHFDAVGLFLMACLMWIAATGGTDARGAGRTGALRWRRPVTLGSLLGLATLVKFAPAATLPPLARRYGGPVVLAFAVVCAALYLPFAGVGPVALTEGLRTYAEHWSANEGAFSLIALLAGDPLRARGAAAAMVLGVVAYTTWRRFSIEQALLWIIGTGLLLSPTVHPWYVLWVLPMAALRGNRPFLLLSGLVFLAYWGLASFQSNGVWPQPGWSRLAIWLPVWMLLVLSAFPGKGANRLSLSATLPLKWRTNPQPQRQIPRREEGNERQ